MTIPDTLIMIYIQKKFKRYTLRSKEAPGNIILESSSILKEVRHLRKGLMLSGIKGMVTLRGQKVQRVNCMNPCVECSFLASRLGPTIVAVPK